MGLFRPTVTRNGLRTKSRVWWGTFRDPATGKMKRVSLGTRDKTSAKSILTQRERDAANKYGGLHVTRDERSLDAHLGEYERYLLSKGDTQRHVRGTLTYLRRWRDAGSPRGSSEVSRWIAESIPGSRTRNAHLIALKGFSRWMWQEGRWQQDPFQRLRKWNEATDRRYVRRPLSDEEVRKLLTNKRIHLARLNAYRLALECGLRASEVRGKWKIIQDILWLPATTSKNRKEWSIPVSSSLSASITRSGVDLPLRANDALHWDLLRSAISPSSTMGVVDFHSLRHTFVTRLVKAGVHPAILQKLARHADISTTMKYYTHLDDGDLREALQKIS